MKIQSNYRIQASAANDLLKLVDRITDEINGDDSMEALEYFNEAYQEEFSKYSNKAQREIIMEALEKEQIWDAFERVFNGNAEDLHDENDVMLLAEKLSMRYERQYPELNLLLELVNYVDGLSTDIYNGFVGHLKG